LLLLLLIHLPCIRYTGWRFVRGEGNCYFRAVAFAAIEHHIMHGNCDILLIIAADVASVQYGNSYHNAPNQALIDSLKRVGTDKGWFADVATDSATAALQFAEDMADPKSTTDGALIRACRELAARQLVGIRSRRLASESAHTIASYVEFSEPGMTFDQVSLVIRSLNTAVTLYAGIAQITVELAQYCSCTTT
jgi:Peptidase C65 Otubain